MAEDRETLAHQVQDHLTTINDEADQQTTRREGALLFLVVAIVLMPAGIGFLLIGPALIAYLLHRGSVRNLEAEKRLTVDALDAVQE